MKLIFGTLSGIIVVIGYIPYLKDILRGKTKPHVYTWFIWIITQGIALSGLLYGGGFGPLGVQLIGVAAVGAYTVVASVIIWTIVKMTVGLRVSPLAEIEGLDEHDHGYAGYVNEDDLSDFAPMAVGEMAMPMSTTAQKMAERVLAQKR